MKTPAVDLDRSPETVDTLFPIRFIADNPLSLVAAEHHAIECPGRLDP